MDQTKTRAVDTLALTLDRSACTARPERHELRVRMSAFTDDFWAFHRVHYYGLGLREPDGTVLPFYVETMLYDAKRDRPGPHAYRLCPTQMALEIRPSILGTVLLVTDDLPRFPRVQIPAATAEEDQAAIEALFGGGR